MKSVDDSSASELPIFSLLHPTDTLPSGWHQAMNEWLQSCLHPQSVEYILCIDRGRERDLGVFYPMVRSHGSHKGVPVKLPNDGFGAFHITVNRNHASPINAYDQAASIAQGRYLLLCSDHSDYPPPLWDQLILNSSDSQGQIHSHLRSLCPLLMTRKEYQDMGQIVKEHKLCRI